MKYFLAALALGAATVHAQPPLRGGGDLRQALQQYHPARPAPQRQLSPAERAELRRQLIEFNQPRQQRR